jgi:hypothetical protein
VFDSDHRLEGGQIVLADAPGLGITFDEARLAEHAVDRPTSESSSAAYRRAEDSGISEPGIPLLAGGPVADG